MASSSGIPVKVYASSSNFPTRHSSSTSAMHSSRSHSRRSGPHINPFGGGDRMNAREDNDDKNHNARLLRQQFRQKCQEAMARDRNRDRERKLQKSRESGSSAPNSDTDGYTTYGTENSLSSDCGNGLEIEQMNEEEEAIRRIMTAEYRRMLKKQEEEGSLEVGWLGPDEVAWLEEEIRKEDQLEHEQSMEPPPDMVDEDEELCDIFEHAQSQACRPSMTVDSGLQDDEDLSWIHEVDCEIWDGELNGNENMDVTM